MKFAATLIGAWLALVAVTPTAKANDGVLQAMARGGHVIVMRHARISGHAKSLVLDANGNCANEENLSDEGRVQAQRLKALLDQAGVRFEIVLSSPFCRTRDTAALAFGKATVERALTALDLGTQAEGQARTQAITEQLARHAGKGNVALVTHRPNIDALTMELVEEGEAVIAKIQSNGTLDVIGRIKP